VLQNKLKNLILISLTVICGTVLANGAMPQDTQPLYQQPIASLPTTKKLVQERIDLETRPWSIMFYAGSTTKTQFGQLISGEYNSAHETLYSAELAYTLHQDNILRRILSPLVGTIQLAANLAYRIEHRNTPKSGEGDIYMIFRWINFPWNNYLTTTLAAGEGVSYVTRIPSIETDGTTSDDSRRLLNYLMFEATFALPSHPEWQLIARIHHRSTAYGTFGNTNGGSNNIGLGIRYYFDF